MIIIIIIIIIFIIIIIIILNSGIDTVCNIAMCLLISYSLLLHCSIQRKMNFKVA